MSYENQLEIVQEMLDKADKHGLSAEVIWSAINDDSSDSIEDKCKNALLEWDI